MLLISNIKGARERGLPRPTAVTIGNFDGCHLGHQKLISSIRSTAEKLGAVPIALTFHPRPEAFFKKKTSENLLFNSHQKHRAFYELGLAATVVQSFDDDFSMVDPESFFTQFLVGELGARAITVGSNFRFGRGRTGDTDTLKAYSIAKGTTVHVCDSCNYFDEIISSSRIRNAITRGEVAAAVEMLGRPYVLEGTIVKGDQLGRKLGVPTANLSGVDQLIPATGVYFVRVFLGAEAPIMATPPSSLPAICSISFRPTLSSGDSLRIETHILAGRYELDSLYGKEIGIYFDKRLRDDKKFANFEELKNAIQADLATARRFYNLPSV